MESNYATRQAKENLKASKNDPDNINSHGYKLKVGRDNAKILAKAKKSGKVAHEVAKDRVENDKRTLKRDRFTSDKTPKDKLNDRLKDHKDRKKGIFKARQVHVDRAKFADEAKVKQDAEDRRLAMKKRHKKVDVVLGGAAGAVAGAGLAHVGTSGLRKQVSSLIIKKNKTPEDLAKIKSLKKKIALIKVGSGIAGAGAGGYLAHKYSK